MKHQEIQLNKNSFNPSVATFGILINKARPDIKEIGVVQFNSYIELGGTRCWSDKRYAKDEYYFIPCKAEVTIKEPDIILKGQTFTKEF